MMIFWYPKFPFDITSWWCCHSCTWTSCVAHFWKRILKTAKECIIHCGQVWININKQNFIDFLVCNQVFQKLRQNWALNFMIVVSLLHRYLKQNEHTINHPNPSTDTFLVSQATPSPAVASAIRVLAGTNLMMRSTTFDWVQLRYTRNQFQNEMSQVYLVKG